MNFIPKNLIVMDAFYFFGLILLMSHIFGEIVSKTKIIPRISGYILLGAILGPNFFNFIDESMLSDFRSLTDACLGMALFMIGRHFDFTWLKNDKGLLLTGLSDFFLTTAVITCLVVFLGWPIWSAFLSGIVAATTSSSVLLLISKDLSSEGPVTRRALTITSMNNFLAIASFALILPIISSDKLNTATIALESSYRFLASILLSYIIFIVYELICFYIIEKNKEKQFVLLIGILIASIYISKILNLSTMLVLISLGIATRNFDKKHTILEIDFGWISHLLFTLLFFLSGCYLNFDGFKEAPLIVISCILLRLISKSIPIFMFKKTSHLNVKQCIAISAALTPITGVAMIGITSKVIDFNPDIGQKLLLIVSSTIAFWDLIGPVLTQNAFIRSDEAFDNEKRV